MEKKINAEKLQALLDNEELMSKLSAENATAKDYAEVFKTADIELTEEEAQQLKDMVKKIVADPNKALNDADLENVSGGLGEQSWDIYYQKATSDLNKTVILFGAGALLPLGCFVASKITKDPETKQKLSRIGFNLAIAYNVMLIGYKRGNSIGSSMTRLDDETEFSKYKARHPEHQ